MELHELLKLCLLALESRYPESVVEVNETLLGHQSFWGEACVPSEMLEVLRLHAQQLLLAPACLVIDQGQSAIYLVEPSEREPAFWVYCGGCTPSQRAKQLAKISPTPPSLHFRATALPSDFSEAKDESLHRHRAFWDVLVEAGRAGSADQ